MASIKKYKFTSILGWSFSRYDTFRKCKRQYYYQYYGKFDKKASQINFLKRLTSIPLEIGNITHDVIAELLKMVRKDSGKAKYKSLIDFSERESKRQLKERCFFEKYYKQKEEIKLDDLFTKVKNCLDSFRQSKWKNWLFAEGIKESEKWIIEPAGYGETRVGGGKAYLKVDFIFPKNGRVVVLDWKTGKRDSTKHKNQLIGYVYYASKQFEVGVDTIDAHIIYLGDEYGELIADVNDFDISNFEDKVREEIKNMYDYCSGIEENSPLPKEEFQMIENLNICKFCNYKELCGR